MSLRKISNASRIKVTTVTKNRYIAMFLNWTGELNSCPLLASCSAIAALTSTVNDTTCNNNNNNSNIFVYENKTSPLTGDRFINRLVLIEICIVCVCV